LDLIKNKTKPVLAWKETSDI